MRFRTLCIAFATAALSALPALATPLDQGSWYQVARMAPDGDMFDGNGELQSTYSFGSFTALNQADDFARPFDTYAGMQIVFITGNESIWASGSYSDLRDVIDARAGSLLANYTWDEVNFGGLAIQSNVAANVLSRQGISEDPWIGLESTHFGSVIASKIIWGEDAWFSSGRLYTDLMMLNNGVNVFVSLETAPVPLPATLPLLGFALAAVGGFGCYRRAKGRKAG